MPASLIEAEGISKVFRSPGHEDVRALDAVSLSIRENEFFTLLGPSGCGKTTLLRIIAGFEFPTSGRLLLGGEDIAEHPPNRRPVNTVFQNYALFPHMTVAENIAFGLEMLGTARGEVEDRVAEMLALVRMDELARRKPGALSGGQQQRVALARALAPHPQVLLLDEPLSALDYKLRKEMQVELKRLQHETGITFIFVTHDQEEALTMSDRIAVMNGGRVLQVGEPRDIYDHPTDRFVAGFIGETNLLHGTCGPPSGDQVDVRLPNGQTIRAGLPEGFEPKGATTVAIRPEHARLAPGAEADGFKGTVENIVYFGTDTHYYVRLSWGESFVVRQQNQHLKETDYPEGTTVSIKIAPETARVIRD